MDKLLRPGVCDKIISSVMNFLSAEEYKALKSGCGYFKIETEIDTQQYEFKTLDDVIDTTKGWLQGAVDFSNIDEDVIKRIREKCEQKDGPALTISRTYLYVVLTK